MSDFADWSLERQRAFWLHIAEDALRKWRLSGADVAWLGYSSNAVFQVNRGDARFTLRLHRPGAVNADHLRSELLWLSHIRHATDLLAPLPVAPVDSDRLYATLASPQLPGHTIHACLFEFLPGSPKSVDALSRDDMRRIGILLGRLHTRAQFSSAGGFHAARIGCLRTLRR